MLYISINIDGGKMATNKRYKIIIMNQNYCLFLIGKGADHMLNVL
jgi:hypothetical protein